MRSFWLVLTVTACASAPSTGSVRPDEMSAAGHEAEAQREESAAAWHTRQYDPYAGRPCIPNASANDRDPCYTNVGNPTAEHLREAEAHRRHAAEHRAASKLLRGAEATACRGVASEDRDLSPFCVVFKPIPGMTPEFLQRLVDCHLARNAAMGTDMPEMEYCPLALSGVTAQVLRVWDGLAIEVRSSKPETALRILARANALTQ